jgi:tripartite-type tricarboxylate transporter receptor subunit TctC
MHILHQKLSLWTAVSLLLCAILVGNGQAGDNYPSKPITIILAYSPGGATDIGARAIATYIGKYLKTSVIISNIPGASGVIGYTKAYTAKPDGYTLLAWNNLTPQLEEYKRSGDVGYKTLKFTSLAAFSRDGILLVTHPDSSGNFADFVKQAKSQTLNIGTTGLYTISGLQGILMAEELGIKANWVTFSGGAECLTTLAGRHINAAMTLPSSAMSLIKAGKIVPLLNFGDIRSPKYPTVPVPGELGYNIPVLSSYLGIVGPPGLDKAKVKILEEAILKAAKDPEYIAWTEKASAAERVLLSASAYQQETARLGQVTERYKRFLK